MLASLASCNTVELKKNTYSHRNVPMNIFIFLSPINIFKSLLKPTHNMGICFVFYNSFLAQVKSAIFNPIDLASVDVARV